MKTWREAVDELGHVHWAWWLLALWLVPQSFLWFGLQVSGWANVLGLVP